MLSEHKKNLIPQIIVDYVEKLNDTKSPKFQRETYCSNLERIRDACDSAIIKYKQPRTLRSK